MVYTYVSQHGSTGNQRHNSTTESKLQVEECAELYIVSSCTKSNCGFGGEEDLCCCEKLSKLTAKEKKLFLSLLPDGRGVNSPWLG